MGNCSKPVEAPLYPIFKIFSLYSYYRFDPDCSPTLPLRIMIQTNLSLNFLILIPLKFYSFWLNGFSSEYFKRFFSIFFIYNILFLLWLHYTLRCRDLNKFEFKLPADASVQVLSFLRYWVLRRGFLEAFLYIWPLRPHHIHGDHGVKKL